MKKEPKTPPALARVVEALRVAVSAAASPRVVLPATFKALVMDTPPAPVKEDPP